MVSLFSLDFPYTYGQSSVLLVTEVAYNDCASDSPLASDGGEGDMAITLTSAQTFYFISGYADQCSQGLRLVVNVLDAPTLTITTLTIIITTTFPPHLTTTTTTFPRHLLSFFLLPIPQLTFPTFLIVLPSIASLLLSLL